MEFANVFRSQLSKTTRQQHCSYEDSACILLLEQPSAAATKNSEAPCTKIEKFSNVLNEFPETPQIGKSYLPYQSHYLLFLTFRIKRDFAGPII